MAGIFQTTKGEKFATPISVMDDYIDRIISTHKTAVTDTVSEILGKKRQ